MAEPRPSALRSAGIGIAVGTVASRVTGFARTAIVGTAIGLTVGDAYNAANTIPNALYDLLLGGVLSAVVVPLLTEAAARDDDEGESFAQRLITLVVLVLLVISIIAVIFARPIVSAYAASLRPKQLDLAVTFGRFFLPQVLFYGAGGVIAAVLNTRDRYIAPMWAPVLNNLIVIITGLIFAGIVSGKVHVSDVHGSALTILGIGTTAGIVVQTIALLPALHRSGVRLRPNLHFRGMGLRSSGGFAGWTLVYVIANQIGFLVITRLATAAGRASGADHVGLSVYSYAYVLFSLPYAIVGVTVMTAVFPAMSRSGNAGDRPAVRQALDRGLSIAAVLLVPGSAAIIAFSTLIMTIVFAHGSITLLQARQSGAVLAAFGVGLVPFAAFQMQFRAWLAIRDARTPALINIAATAANLIADVILYFALPHKYRDVGLAIGFSLSYIVALQLSTRRLDAALGTPNRRGLVVRTHVRLGLATVIAVIPTYVIRRALGAVVGQGPGASVLVLLAAGVIGGAIFITVAARLRIREIGELVGLIKSRLPGVGTTG